MCLQKCPLNVQIAFEYTGVHRSVDLSNRKCDIGRFPSDSALRPSGNILLFSPPTPPGNLHLYRPPSLLEFLVTFHGTTHLQHLTRKLGIPYISYKVQKRCNTKSVGYTVQIEKPELDLVVITPCHLTKINR